MSSRFALYCFCSHEPGPDYVLQRALTVAEGDQKEQLISKVRPHLVNMRRYSSAYSKHLSASECFAGTMYLICPNHRSS